MADLPKLSVFDDVEVVRSGRRGFVCAIRRYVGDGESDHYAYVVNFGGGLEDESGGGIYDETDLRPLGSRTSLDAVALPNGLRPGDEVEIHGSSGSRLGILTEGWSEDDDGMLFLSVWLSGPEEMEDVALRDLVPTGRREPPRSNLGASERFTLGPDGTLVSVGVEYVVLDDIAEYM